MKTEQIAFAGTCAAAVVGGGGALFYYYKNCQALRNEHEKDIQEIAKLKEKAAVMENSMNVANQALANLINNSQTISGTTQDLIQATNALKTIMKTHEAFVDRVLRAKEDKPRPDDNAGSQGIQKLQYRLS